MEKRNCEIGDLVVILDKNMHRSYQPLAIIIKIRHNRDDVVRVAKVKIANREHVRQEGNLRLHEHSSFHNKWLTSRLSVDT